MAKVKGAAWFALMAASASYITARVAHFDWETKLPSAIPLSNSTTRHTSEKLLRVFLFLLIVFFSVLIYWAPLSLLVGLSFHYDFYSHILLIPIMSAALVYLRRGKIFANPSSSFGSGIGVLLMAAFLYGFEKANPLAFSRNDTLSIAFLSLVVMWMGGFLLSFGASAFCTGLFPLFFLFLMVPVPESLLGEIVYLLQKGSAEVAWIGFRLVGVPVFRDGLFFSLPGVTIEVAKECSGIRSSLALLIACLLAAHLFLRSAWRKVALVSCVVPLVVIKNGIRIVTLSLLAVYVDPGFLTGNLHRQGGILFFLIALLLLLPLLRTLQRYESKLEAQG